ncbi:MAG: hypothetical protein O7G30_04675 [Proteobacteria bacterium]|nr:hypothetical protein [Pseudomonadota bacterium]
MTATETPSWPDDIPARSTLLALVQLLERRLGLSEDQVVTAAMRLVDTGRVVLTGNFAGCRLGNA